MYLNTDSSSSNLKAVVTELKVGLEFPAESEPEPGLELEPLMLEIYQIRVSHKKHASRQGVFFFNFV